MAMNKQTSIVYQENIKFSDSQPLAQELR